MNVLITGGAGYIGSVLSKSLAGRGHNVRIVDFLMYGYNPLARNGFSIEEDDVRLLDSRYPWIEEADVVIHLAALTLDQCDRWPMAAEQINVTAAKQIFNLIEVAKRPRLFIFASSCSIYGLQDGLCTEETIPNPTTYYAELKIAVEAYFRHRLGDRQPLGRKTRCLVLRFATAYGLSPRQRWDLPINQFAREMWRGNPIDLYGSSQWRPFIHVQDIARAMEILIESDSRSPLTILNVGSDEQNYQKKNLLDEIGAKYRTVPRDDRRSYKVSFKKIRDLGFEPKYTPREAVHEISRALKDRTVVPNDSVVVERLLSATPRLKSGASYDN